MMESKKNKGWWIKRPGWRSLALLIAMAAAYVGVYETFARHEVLLEQMCGVQYPGATRLYAFEGHSAAVLGRTAVEILPGSPEAEQTELLDDSIYTRNAWYGGLWKMFYPLERAEHAWRGLKTLPINYAVAELKAPSTAEGVASAVPHNCVYRETYLRNGQLCRIISEEQTRPTPGTRVLGYTTNAWVLRWDVGNVADGARIAAASVTRLDVRNRLGWASHVEMKGPLFLSFENQDDHISVLKPSDDGSPAQEVKRGSGFGVPHWCSYSDIPVDPSGAFFMAERDGLRVFRSDTLEPVRELKSTVALERFGAPRPDELGNDNSKCFLLHEAGLFVRVANIYRIKTDQAGYPVAIVYDFVHDTVRDIELRIDDRTTLHGMEWAEGRLWFYVVTATVNKDKTGVVWTHVVTDERQEKVFRTLADESSDELLWDRERGWLVRSRGYTANPKALPLDTEVQVFDYREGTSRTFRIDFRDAEGKPGLFGLPGK